MKLLLWLHRGAPTFFSLGKFFLNVFINTIHPIKEKKLQKPLFKLLPMLLELAPPPDRAPVPTAKEKAVHAAKDIFQSQPYITWRRRKEEELVSHSSGHHSLVIYFMFRAFSFSCLLIFPRNRDDAKTY